MGFLKKTPQQKAREKEIKKGEANLKKIIGTQILRNHSFFRLMTINGIKKKERTWQNINSQVKKELKDGSLKANDVQKRVNELLIEKSPNSRLITQNDVNRVKEISFKQEMIRKGRVAISIPYTKSGVNDAIVGGAFFGKWGAVLGSLNEGAISWSPTELLFIDGGISIRATGKVVFYEDMKNVILTDDGFAFSIITVLTSSGENLVYRTGKKNANASKAIIEERMHKSLPNVTNPPKIEKKEPKIEKSLTGDADPLLKYAELYEKGLLTKEEFEIKKSEIFGVKNNAHDSIGPEEENIDLKNNFCSNCGAPVVEGSKFCTECGSKL